MILVCIKKLILHPVEFSRLFDSPKNGLDSRGYRMSFLKIQTKIMLAFFRKHNFLL
jgi:hypothetical protein